jgi:hypothetical protein
MNTETKHTPAPWRLVNDAQGPCMIMHPTKEGVAIASLTNTFLPVNGFVEIEAVGAPERTANAKLIAASPVMLQEMLRYLPVLIRAELNPEVWSELTHGTGIATLNGYRKAFEGL